MLWILVPLIVIAAIATVIRAKAEKAREEEARSKQREKPESD